MLLKKPTLKIDWTLVRCANPLPICVVTTAACVIVVGEYVDGRAANGNGADLEHVHARDASRSAST